MKCHCEICMEDLKIKRSEYFTELMKQDNQAEN